MGRSAWQTALSDLIQPSRGQTHILMGCKLAAMCPHDDLWERFLLQLLTSQSGLTVLMGIKLASEGRPLPAAPALYTIWNMQSVPGTPSSLSNVRARHYCFFVHTCLVYSELRTRCVDDCW